MLGKSQFNIFYRAYQPQAYFCLYSSRSDQFGCGCFAQIAGNGRGQGAYRRRDWQPAYEEYGFYRRDWRFGSCSGCALQVALHAA